MQTTTSRLTTRTRWSDAVLVKADRLLNRGGVFATPDPHTFVVVGDTGRRTVRLTVLGGRVVGAHCSCPHGGPNCSHVAAVLTVRRRSLTVPTVALGGDQPADPFAGL